MSAVVGRRDYGLYTNGQAELESDLYFATYNYYTGDGLSGNSCFVLDYNVYGSGMQGEEYIPVDTSKYYQHSVSVKTITNNYLGNPGSGHLGFACYDENKVFIDLRNCKGVGDTTLTRAATPGDTSIYVADASGWSTSTTTSQRGFMLFGGIYPYSGGYSRYTVTSNFYPTTGLTNLGGGEWRIDLSGTLPTWSAALVNGVYPVGTYISNGRAGGTYNYAHGSPNYPASWTTYTTPAFTGESRNSSYPFRYGTKYIRFLNLRNYNYRSQNAGDSARYLIDNIMFVEVPGPTGIESAFFEKTNRRRPRRGS